MAHPADPPPLQGGVEKKSIERDQPKAYCEEFSRAVDFTQGSLEVMPKAGQGNRDFCMAPRESWTLLGEDRGRCCFFAPREWKVKIPPLPPGIDVVDPGPDRRPGPTIPGGTGTGVGTGKPPIGKPPAPPGIDPSDFRLTVDRCFAWKAPHFRSVDWRAFKPPSGWQPPSEYERAFPQMIYAVEHAMRMDAAAFGPPPNREREAAYLTGWLSHCLGASGVLPYYDPRVSFARFLRTQQPPLSATSLRKRQTDFNLGYRNYPLPPFRDRNSDGSPQQTDR